MLPEPPVLQWLFAGWLWLLRECRGRETGTLVTPTRRSFPLDETAEQHLLEQYFAQVRRLAGVEDWPLALVEDGPESETPEGTLPVCYSHWALGEPTVLVAQLAVGIGEHLVHRTDHGTPEDPSTLEMMAELAAVYLGFGVFVANAAGRAAQPPEAPLVDWRRQPSALGERELAYALAIFAWLEEIPDDDVCVHLDPNPRAFYRTATKDLRRRGKELGALRAAGDRVNEGPYR